MGAYLVQPGGPNPARLTRPNVPVDPAWRSNETRILNVIKPDPFLNQTPKKPAWPSDETQFLGMQGPTPSEIIITIIIITTTIIIIFFSHHHIITGVTKTLADHGASIKVLIDYDCR